MASEDTPLLASETPTLVGEYSKHDAIYERFSPQKKRWLVALVSGAGLLPLLISGSFIPSIPQIARDFDSTGAVISLAVSLSIFSAAFGTLFWASHSTFYGRRPIYLTGLPLLCLGSVGVARAQGIPQLMSWRCIQAFGSAGGMSVGAGVIGDIYKLEERGGAMGIFFAASLLGMALAPICGGIAAHYSSWRDVQYALCGAGFIVFVLMAAFLPETSHPGARGIEKVAAADDAAGRARTRFTFVNPLGSLGLLRSPNLVTLTTAGAMVLFTDYILLVPMAYTIGRKYNITNEAIIGACFLPSGLGNAIGAPLAGRISDRIVVKWRARRGGVWVPEDRLRCALLGAGVLVPVSVLASGLITHFVGGTAGLVLNLVCFFVNGLGVDFVLSPAAAYGVDIMHARSAESMAASTGLRSLFLSLAVAGILPLIDAVGVAWADVIAAAVGWVGFGLLWCTIRYGDRMRAWVNVGYSTAETN